MIIKRTCVPERRVGAPQGSRNALGNRGGRVQQTLFGTTLAPWRHFGARAIDGASFGARAINGAGFGASFGARAINGASLWRHFGAMAPEP